MRLAYAVIKNIAVGRSAARLLALARWRAALCDQYLGRYALGDRYADAGRCGNVAGGRGAIERGGRPRGQAAVCGQSHQQRCGRAGRADRRGREAACGRARRKLSDALPGWKPDLRDAYLSESSPRAHRTGQPHGAGVGDYGDRYGARRGGRSHSAARSRGRLSSGLLRRWTAGRGGRISSQESCAAGASGTRRRLCLHADAVWRGCGQAGGDSAGRVGALCVAALRRGHCAGQVAHLCHLRRLGDGDGYRRAAAVALCSRATSRTGCFVAGSCRQRKLCCGAHSRWDTIRAGLR